MEPNDSDLPPVPHRKRKFNKTVTFNPHSCRLTHNKNKVDRCADKGLNSEYHYGQRGEDDRVQVCHWLGPYNRLKSKLKYSNLVTASKWMVTMYLMFLFSMPATAIAVEGFIQPFPRSQNLGFPNQRAANRQNVPSNGWPQGFGGQQELSSQPGFSNLERGPLTLMNGRLRPIAEDRLDQTYFPEKSEFPNFMSQFPAGGVKEEPEIHMTRLPGSQEFNTNIHDFKEFNSNIQNIKTLATNVEDLKDMGLQSQGNRKTGVQITSRRSDDYKGSADLALNNSLLKDAGIPQTAEPVQSDTGEWSTKVDQITSTKKEVVLDTKYFSITLPEPSLELTSEAGQTSVTGKPSLVLRKVKGKMKTSTLDPEHESSTVRLGTGLCEERSSILECSSSQTTNLNSSVLQDRLPSYQDILKHFRHEVWVIPVLVAAAIVILVLIIFEIFLLAKAINKNPSRRHLFLGQMLLLGLLTCAGMSVVYTLNPTVVSCAVLRLGTGLSYSVVYSTLLVKLVFLVSLNSGVYLPATYQSLLLCFAVLIQLVIGIQWLVSAPPDIVDLALSEGTTFLSCGTQFKQQLLGLLYVVFLIVVVVLLAFKSRGVRENYREAIYVGLTMGFTVAIWVVWVLAGFIVPTQFQDVCTACGLIACTSITFVIMFMPKGRQLSAMGKEGLYAEDRTEVYTGSGTGSTGSSGTPSPSFFPVKPGKLSGGRIDSKERGRMDTPTSSHSNLQIFGSPSARDSRRDHRDSAHKDSAHKDSAHRDSAHRDHHFSRDERAEREDKFRREDKFHREDRYVREDRFPAMREDRFVRDRVRSSSPRPSHLYGHPLFRSSHVDLARPRQIHRGFSSQRDLSRLEPFRLGEATRSDPVRFSARRGLTEGGRSKEILATISPRRLPSCSRCLPPTSAAAGYTSRQEDSVYNSLEVLNSDRFPYKSQPSRSNPNVLFRRPNDMPAQIIY